MRRRLNFEPPYYFSPLAFLFCIVEFCEGAFNCFWKENVQDEGAHADSESGNCLECTAVGFSECWEGFVGDLRTAVIREGETLNEDTERKTAGSARQHVQCNDARSKFVYTEVVPGPITY